MKEQILGLTKQYYNDIVKLRRTIHREPELAFEEKKTSSLVAKTLQKIGLKVETGIAKTGVVGVLKGASSGKCIAIRADMDALPILEQTGLQFASTNKGVMHACGHDSHTAMALGAAMVLSQMKNNLRGTVKFLFQPSEEKAPGGASVMVAEGALKNPDVDAVIGQHVLSQAESGTVGFCPGPMMASSDELYITILGKGGHGARPNLTIDPIVIASHVVIALQTIVSRRTDPFKECVLTIGKFSGGTATNIIPNEVSLWGTLRAMDEKLRARAHKMIDETISGVTRAMGAGYEFRIVQGYPAVVNDKEITEFASKAAADLLGKKNVFRA
ncbi:MAG TPA: M20 family metallopeptidase, partial [Candidatus Kapabacteria bacterium]|nr:M20 family metallopeptidase [Candidatus Kapabacteria bacterium]